MLDKFFKISENNTTISTEIIAGITTFLTMCYIIAVNPAILKDAGMPVSSVVVATILVSALSSIFMGLFANLPYALAPGMGTNAFFTYTLVATQGVPWQVALGATFISGIIFLVLTLLNIRTLIVLAIPKTLRYSIAAGIGIFIAFIGLKNAGLIVSHSETLVTHGQWKLSITIFCIAFAATSILVILKKKTALLIGIGLGVFLGWITGDVKLPENLISQPNFSTFGQLNIVDACSLVMIGPIFSIFMTDLFDSIATFLGVAQASNLIDEDGQPKNIRPALFVDAISTTISGIFGTSAGTTFIESASGIESGGRTGLTAVVTGILFLPFLFFGGVIEVIPAYATAPALVIVGIFMCEQLKHINFQDYEEGIPAFLAVVLIPLTFSITQGIVWSFISYTFFKIVLRKSSEVHPMMFVVALFSVFIVFVEYS